MSEILSICGIIIHKDVYTQKNKGTMLCLISLVPGLILLKDNSSIDMIYIIKFSRLLRFLSLQRDYKESRCMWYNISRKWNFDGG